MYEVSIRAHFSSAHNLRGYEGKCESLHGHNWEFEIAVYSETLDHLGMVIDFKLLKAWAREITERLDHKYINEIDPFTGINPSSENIARHIYEEIEKRLSGETGHSMSHVSVWESTGNCATYRK